MQLVGNYKKQKQIHELHMNLYASLINNVINDLNCN